MTTEATAQADRLLDQALDLPLGDRADLAYALIRSLDDPCPEREAVDKAWDEEIARRIAKIDAGEAEFVTLEEFRKNMQATLAATQCAK